MLRPRSLRRTRIGTSSLRGEAGRWPPPPPLAGRLRRPRTSTHVPWAQFRLADPTEAPAAAGELPLLQTLAPACSGAARLTPRTYGRRVFGVLNQAGAVGRRQTFRQQETKLTIPHDRRSRLGCNVLPTMPLFGEAARQGALFAHGSENQIPAFLIEKHKSRIVCSMSAGTAPPLPPPSPPRLRLL